MASDGSDTPPDTDGSSSRRVLRAPPRRIPPTDLGAPSDEDDDTYRVWFVDENDEAGRIDDDLGLEYDGDLGVDIETVVDGVLAAAPGTDAVDFGLLSVRLYAETALRRLVHVPR